VRGEWQATTDHICIHTGGWRVGKNQELIKVGIACHIFAHLQNCWPGTVTHSPPLSLETEEVKKYEITKNINVSNNVDNTLINTHRKLIVTFTELVKKKGTDQQVLCWNIRTFCRSMGTE
jgi:hypothetical protein